MDYKIIKYNGDSYLRVENIISDPNNSANNSSVINYWRQEKTDDKIKLGTLIKDDILETVLENIYQRKNKLKIIFKNEHQ